MSFQTQQRHIVTNPSPATHAAGDEYSFEGIVRRNIHAIHANLQSTEENLESLSRNLVSRRIVDSLHDRLKETYEIVVETERTFREWTIQLAGNPYEKQRRKFSFEKLSAHFQAEVKRVQQLSERVQRAAVRVAEGANLGGTGDAPFGNSKALNEGEEVYGGPNGYQQARRDESVAQREDRLDNCMTVCSYEDDNICLISDKSNDQTLVTEMGHMTEHERLIQRTVAEDRLKGIKRIQNQVSQANQIFRDLASLVTQQGSQIDTIDGHLESSASSSRSAVSELRKAYVLQQKSRQRRCGLLLIAVILLMTVLWLTGTLTHIRGALVSPLRVSHPPQASSVSVTT